MSTRFYSDNSYANKIYRGDSDFYFTNVSLLLHFDGTNGSTTFTDFSSSPKTITANGNAQISTAQSKFGGASGYFDGTGDYLSVPDDAGFEFTTGDFTIEFYLYIPTGAATGAAVINKGTWPTNTSSYLIYYGGSNELAFYASSNGTSWDIATDKRFAVPISKNTQHHVAVVRNGTTITGYFNGTSAFTQATTASLNNNAQALTIGSGASGSSALNCYIDELRITKGIARYTANFTPPTIPFLNR